MLLRYLELRVAELEQAAAEEVDSKRSRAARTAVGQMITWLLLFVGYALVLGLLSASILNQALLQPEELGHRLRAVQQYAGATGGAVPEPLRGLALAATSAFALFIFRSASFNVRSDVGGALFVGLTVLSLAGLASAASSGVLGFLVALPGFVAATIIVYEFFETLRRLSIQRAPPDRAVQPRIWNRLAAIAELVLPRRHLFLRLLFVGLPWLFVLLILGSVISHAEPGPSSPNGGPLFWPARLSQYGLGAWALWACASTPRVVRAALSSAVPWGGLVGLQLSGDVSVIFTLAAAAMLYVNVMLAVLRWPAPAEQRAQVRGVEPSLQST